MVWHDFSRAVPETFALVGWSTGTRLSSSWSRSRTAVPETLRMLGWSTDMRMVAVTSRARIADPETLPDGPWSEGWVVQAPAASIDGAAHLGAGASHTTAMTHAVGRMCWV